MQKNDNGEDWDHSGQIYLELGTMASKARCFFAVKGSTA